MGVMKHGLFFNPKEEIIIGDEIFFQATSLAFMRRPAPVMQAVRH